MSEFPVYSPSGKEFSSEIRNGIDGCLSRLQELEEEYKMYSEDHDLPNAGSYLKSLRKQIMETVEILRGYQDLHSRVRNIDKKVRDINASLGVPVNSDVAISEAAQNGISVGTIKVAMDFKKAGVSPEVIQDFLRVDISMMPVEQRTPEKILQSMKEKGASEELLNMVRGMIDQEKSE